MNKLEIVWDGFSGHAGENNELYVTLLHNKEIGWSYQLIYETPDNTQMLCVDSSLENSVGASLEMAQKLANKAIVFYRKELKGE